MTDMTVSRTIFQQLGHGRFAMMTGAHSFVGGENSLSFQLKPCGFKKKVNGKAITHVKITLTPADTYTVETFNKKAGVLETTNEVYCDTLQDTFLTMTGLMTRFGQ